MIQYDIVRDRRGTESGFKRSQGVVLLRGARILGRGEVQKAPRETGAPLSNGFNDRGGQKGRGRGRRSGCRTVCPTPVQEPQYRYEAAG